MHGSGSSGSQLFLAERAGTGSRVLTVAEGLSGIPRQEYWEGDKFPIRGVTIGFLEAGTAEPDVAWHLSWPKGVRRVDIPPELASGGGGCAAVPKVAGLFLFKRGGSGSFVNDSAGAIVVSFAQGLAPHLGDLLLCKAKNG